jgi:hypothetical protein
MNFPHAAQQKSCRRFLEHDTFCAKPNGLDHVVAMRGSKDYNARCEAIVLELAHDFDPIPTGHSEIEHKYIWQDLPDYSERFNSVARGAHDLEVVLHFENSNQSLQDDRVIIGNDETYRH